MRFGVNPGRRGDSNGKLAPTGLPKQPALCSLTGHPRRASYLVISDMFQFELEPVMIFRLSGPDKNEK